MEFLNIENSVNYNTNLEGLVNCSDKGIVVAASNLNLSKWTGELFYFKEFVDNLDFINPDACLKLDTNITNIISIENDRLIISSVSGSVMLFDLNILEDSPASFCRLEECNNHDSIIHSISTNSDYTRLISTGQDRSISIYDLNLFKPIASYVAHQKEIVVGSFLPFEIDLFITADQDNNFILWDIRKPKPAQRIDLKFLTSTVSSITFEPSKSGVLAVGTNEGQLFITDMRKPSLICSAQPHTQLISRILFKSVSCDYVATCGHDTKVALTDISTLEAKIIYDDVKHSNYVRGLSWTDEFLLSCSWDGKVLSRKILAQNGHIDE